MLIDLTAKKCITVRQEIADKHFGRDDSWFFYQLKKKLQEMGFDCIKKLAWKDGHLVDNDMPYIRDRKKRWYIFDPMYSVRSVAAEFNRDGEVVLSLVDDEGVFNEARS